MLSLTHQDHIQSKLIRAYWLGPASGFGLPPFHYSPIANLSADASGSDSQRCISAPRVMRLPLPGD